MDKLTLTKAVDSLKAIVQVLEQGEAFDTISEDKILEIAPQLDGAMEDIKTSVDARINFLEYANMMEKKLKADVEYLQGKIRVLQNVQNSVKKHTIYVLENNPTVSFEGERKKLKVYNNGGKQPIEWNAKLQEYKNIIDPNDLEKFPFDMINEVKIYVLNKEKFEAFLSAGGTCEGARALPRDKHLRIV